MNQTQTIKVFNSKLWIGIICILLSISFVAVVWLGIALSVSNDRIAVLQTDLDEVKKSAVALNTEQKELLEKFECSAAEISGFCERDSFIYGFRLGMRLAIEALGDEHDIEEL